MAAWTSFGPDGSQPRIGGVDRREFLAAAAAAPFALRSGGPRPLALVTADLESAVVVVDPFGGRVLRRIETRPDPRSIERVGETAVVAHTAIGEVTLLRGLEVVHVLHSFDEPRYTAGAPDGRHAFVTDSGRKDVAVVDVLHGSVVARLHLGEWPRHVTLDSRGRTLWVALGTEARAAAVVDVTRPAEPRLLGRIKPPFLLHDLGFVPGTGRVWVTSGDRGELAVYDARKGHVLRKLAAGSPPQHVTFHGERGYVTSGNDGTLRVHSLRDGRLLRTATTPVGSYNVQQGPGRILTPSLDHGTLCVLDTQGRVLRRIAVARSSHDACFV
jgi:DNA-binding beta-propeller fold protein YncE